MRKIAIVIATAGVMLGSLATTQTAYAAQIDTHGTPGYTQPQTPGTVPLDCVGTTGSHGCGPGWFWRDGWRGWGCYPC